MERIKIKLVTTHSSEGKQEKINYTVEGTLINTNDYQVISYIDPSQNKDDRIILKNNDHQIKIIRQGSVKSEMVFNKKEKSYGNYEIEGLSLSLQITLKDFISRDDLIKLDYDLFIDGQPAGMFETKIKIIH